MSPLSSAELCQIAQQAAPDYEVVGELGRNGDDDAWFLARQPPERLVALRLRRQSDKGNEQPRIEVAGELSAEVAMGGGECIACDASLRTFARFCSICGADQAAGTIAATSAAERKARLTEVRLAATGMYEVLGEMPYVEGPGIVYFALDRDTGELVRLRLKQTEAGMELDETKATMALGNMVAAAPVRRRSQSRPVIRKRPSGAEASPPSETSSTAPPGRRNYGVLGVVIVVGLLAIFAIMRLLG